MWMRLLLVSVLLVGCKDPYAEAQKADTIAAYESFLSENGTSPKRGMAEVRLEELYLEDAREKQTLAAYDVYMDKYPKGKMRKVAVDERRSFLMGWAQEENTPASWQKYLDEYPTGNSANQRIARRRLNMAKNSDKIAIGPVKMEQVNLAEDPDGPLNGYGFYADITISGDQSVEHLNIEIAYLDENGRALSRDTWPVVAQRLPAGLPMEEGFNKPMAPGAARTWSWTTGDLPETWSKKVKLTATDIRFVSGN